MRNPEFSFVSIQPIEWEAAAYFDGVHCTEDEATHALMELSDFSVLRARVTELERALDRLYSACMEADYHGELDARVDGSILDAARVALEEE